MNSNDYKRAESLSAHVRSLSFLKPKPKLEVKKKKDFPWLKKQVKKKTLQDRANNILSIRPQTKVVKEKVFMGKPGIDGKNGLNGRDGIDGKDGRTPIKNIDYFDGKDGRDAIDITPKEIADKLNTLEGVLETKMFKDLSPLGVDAVIAKLKSLKGNDRLDISNIRNGEQLASLANKASRASGGFNMDDQRWHGSGSAASGSSISATVQVDTFVTTSGQTVFNASHTILAIIVFTISGANQTPTTDYTNTSTQVTLTGGTWPNGTPPDQPVVLVYIKS